MYNMDPKLLERYKTTHYKDVYAKWSMNAPWQREWVREAFIDLRELISVKMTAEELPSCHSLDAELIEILEKHRKGEVAAYQSMFVALILEALDMKRADDYAKKTHSLLTHGYKSHLLSFFIARLLEEDNLDLVIALYKDEAKKNEVLKFFDLS